jgi:sRNA-binding carbon storage regulator CsrA
MGSRHSIVSVIEVLDHKVRHGVDVPSGGTVHRREVYEAITGRNEVQDVERAAGRRHQG